MIADNAKVGSSAIARAIVEAYYPDLFNRVIDADATWWHQLAPKTAAPDRPVYVLIRDPVERFRSAMTQYRLADAGATLARLEAGDPLALDQHFAPQSPFARTGLETHTYRYPDELRRFAAATGLRWPLAQINLTRRPKPDLLPAQEERVRRYYAADVTLWDSVLASPILSNDDRN
ncbi:MAG TPA: hypothetical protein VH092_37020 [Urbifossiella sp.]|nr:hypothetical protein [Urbifossiella sp.]